MTATERFRGLAELMGWNYKRIEETLVMLRFLGVLPLRDKSCQ